MEPKQTDSRLHKACLLLAGIVLAGVCIPSKAISACPNVNGASYFGSKCSLRSEGLTGLFKKQDVNVDATVSGDPAQAQTSSPDSIVIPTKSVRTNVGFQPNHHGHNRLVYQSINKSISEYGTRAPAELRILCNFGKLAVALNFPGYPMRTENSVVDVAYVLDDNGPWVAGFNPGQEFFTIGLWESRTASSFLSSVVHGKKLNISTYDADETKISADFDISNLSSQFQRLIQICNAPN